ncbi:MAG: holo-[acyl-carrier-protein] synthase [Calditrichia bacterium]
MSISGIGIDIIEVNRIEEIIDRYGDKFLRKIFTPAEIQYCSSKIDSASYAARFATKEAVFKSTGLGLRDGMRWVDVEVVNDQAGKPRVNLHGRTAEILKGKKIHVSISHTRDLAIAIIIIE